MIGRKIHHPKPPGWTGPKPSKSGQRSYCGAWSRSRGRPCRQAPVKGWPVCRMHGAGGGAKTDEGKARIAEAQRKAWARWRAEAGLPADWRYGSTWLSRRKRETAADWLAARGDEGSS
jgi:hypothetical protein